ncbi:MAG: hypothetical protein EKK33_35215 [Bradyrhizobiaceae bacterium]|nr:MAG: hypothetical protein EKK33_35215 [Bradyrhizobiaceae bacterium]
MIDTALVRSLDGSDNSLSGDPSQAFKLSRGHRREHAAAHTDKKAGVAAGFLSFDPPILVLQRSPA